MKNFLYTTGIFLLLLSPATCNYEDSALLRTEADGTVINDLPETETVNTDAATTLTPECTTTSEDSEPPLKPKKP